MEILDWLETAPVIGWVRTSASGVASQLVLHALGMASAVGLALLLSLRVLGFGKRLPIAWFGKLGPVLWLGFVLVALSGLLLFFAQGSSMIQNSAFQMKVVFLITGSVSLWLLWRTIVAREAGTVERSPNSKEKLLAAVSLVSWLGAIFYGRMIAYTFSFGG